MTGKELIECIQNNARNDLNEDGGPRGMRKAEAILDVVVEQIGDKEFLYSFSTLDRSFKELIRCKDCKNHGNIDSDYCVRIEQKTDDSFFCGYGKPKDSDYIED